jgi:hypothetical protein
MEGIAVAEALEAGCTEELLTGDEAEELLVGADADDVTDAEDDGPL